MLNITKYSFVVALTLFVSLGFAQEKGKLEFTISDHDFGEINEADGPAIHEFEFVNNGTAPLVISNVKASCGCTTPGWSKEPVAPGEKGYVKAQYNPRNRPGSFRKSLTVTTNGDPSVVYAYIKGKVIPKVKSVEERLTVKVGNLRYEKRNFNVGRITTEKLVEKSFDVYNDGDEAVVFTDQFDGPDFIKFIYEPKTLAPKQTGKVMISYDPNHDDHLGLNNHGVKFYTDEDLASAKTINIIATIREYFPPMTDEELAIAPKLAITDRLRDLGKLNQNTKTTIEFDLTNKGKSLLNIRKVKSNCACLIAVLNKENIKPGKTVTIKATFDSTQRKGNQNKSITVYSNDPKDPVQIVSIKASIVSSN